MKKKITKIILAVCLVVAGLPLFAIGARANDDANTNSEMMISVDNYFDYRNAKLMTASFGAGYTADSMDYPALVCNDVEAPAMAMEAKTNTDLRTSGMMDYFESCKLHLLSWEAFTGEPQDITTMENGLVSCKVYEWVEYTWYSDDFPDPVSSGFGTWHTLTLANSKILAIKLSKIFMTKVILVALTTPLVKRMILTTKFYHTMIQEVMYQHSLR